jgi:dethiobiotin synthetase
VSAIFVTATGTDIGKTYVTAGLIRALRAQGRPASALKPVVSGFDLGTAETSDSGVLLQAMSHSVTPQSIARIPRIWRRREKTGRLVSQNSSLSAAMKSLPRTGRFSSRVSAA